MSTRSLMSKQLLGPITSSTSMLFIANLKKTYHTFMIICKSMLDYREAWNYSRQIDLGVLDDLEHVVVDTGLFCELFGTNYKEMANILDSE